MTEPRGPPPHREGPVGTRAGEGANVTARPAGPSARTPTPEMASRISRSTPGCSWRFSGVALVFLALGHLFIGLIWDNGVVPHRLQLRRTALGLAVLADLGHGIAVAGDGARAPMACAPSSATTPATTSPSSIWNSLLLLATGFTLVLGTYVLVTFDASNRVTGS